MSRAVSDIFRLELDADGTLWQRGREGWHEPVCGVCGDPIRWVLDMASFKQEPSGFVMCHARCVWTKGAFDRERDAAPGLDTAEKRDPLSDALVAVFEAIAEREGKSVEQVVEDFFYGYVEGETS